ncbi:hypothetical protein N431DRAFT_455150 [Stipitochalara longipes BDJ]|nr:hypothetical protein N431DRAFT_455150 [Stipitochalara longipes BDJ]
MEILSLPGAIHGVTFETRVSDEPRRDKTPGLSVQYRFQITLYASLFRNNDVPDAYPETIDAVRKDCAVMVSLGEKAWRWDAVIRSQDKDEEERTSNESDWSPCRDLAVGISALPECLEQEEVDLDRGAAFPSVFLELRHRRFLRSSDPGWALLIRLLTDCGDVDMEKKDLIPQIVNKGGVYKCDRRYIHSVFEA